MNVRESVARLPESLARLIGASASATPLLARGIPLEDVLRSEAWADRFLATADAGLVRMLRALLRRFAGVPFEQEQADAVLAEESFTGAEARVGLARLRREGAAFAVRKAWGDRLFYVPADVVPIWQRRLLPIDVDEATSIESAPVALAADLIERLPLSIELLLAWHTMRGKPIAFTSKGALNRTGLARLVAPMRMSPEDLAALAFAYPDSEHLPRQAAFALDVGLCVGALARTGADIRLDEDGLPAWLAQSARRADARLHELLAERYASADPQLHLAASAIASLPSARWLKTRALESVAPADRADAWLRVLVGCGWVERGLSGETPVFRKTEAYPNACDAGTAEGDCESPLLVQPDGEILVTPDVGLAARWTLETVAERVAADALFVYRLTRAACADAYDAGFGLRELSGFLSGRSGEPLPDQVADALGDWYAGIGRTRLTEETLLRTASAELAARLKEDPELTALGLEPVGDRDFIVNGAARKAIEARLAGLGFPPASSPDKSRQGAAVPAAAATDGCIYRPRSVRDCEADRDLPDLEALFPGILDIPASWLREPRAYHVSTREAIVRRAIDWRAPLLVRHADGTRQFVPRGIARSGAEWRALGHWREEAGDIAGLVDVGGDALAEVMIILPDLEAIEND